MNSINNDIIYKICECLENYEVFNILKTCKYFNILENNKLFIEKIKCRDHPIVFNVFDNFCHICNFYSLFFLDENTTFTQCYHGSFPEN